MTLITGTTWGTVYLLHLAAPLGNLANTRAMAQHYIGWCLDLDERIEQHRRGIGSKMLAAAVQRGITFEVVATWHAPVMFEKALKRRKESPKLCPVCCKAHGWRVKHATPAARQLALDLWTPASDELPDLPPTRQTMDWYELSTLKQWRAAGVVERPALADNWDEGLL